MKNVIRFVSVLLVLVFLVGIAPLVPLQVSATEGEDWRTWKQSDSRWGSVRLGKSSITMSSDGCLVTSVAKIMVQSGFVDPDSFNPLTLVTWLNSKNYFTETGALHMDNVARYIDGFELAAHTHGLSGKSSSIENQILDLVHQNYHIILKVGGHFIAVDHYKSLATDRVYIMDTLKEKPNADVLLVDRYSQVDRVSLYSGWCDTTNYPDYSSYVDADYPCYVNVKTDGAYKLWNMPCSDETSSEAKELARTEADTTYLADRIYLNKKGNYWYRIWIGSTKYYLFAGNVSIIEQRDPQITVPGLVVPQNLTEGKIFNLEGNIQSPHLPLCEVGAYIYIGSQGSGNPYKSSTESLSNVSSYDIRSNAVNKNLKFGELPVGTYTYRLIAKVTRRAASNKYLNTWTSEDIILAEQVFTVGSHVCDKGTYMWQWDAHPHYSCYKCSVCGTVKEDTSEPNKVNTCDQCRPGKPVLNVNTGSNGTVTFTWSPTANTTHYNVWLQKQNDAGEWQSIEQVFYAESGFSRTFDPGNYRAQLLSYSSEMWEPDNSDWVHTWADDVYFTIANSTYTIRYDANGGTGAPSSQEKTHGQDLTLSTTVPSRFGYSFLGWSTSSGAVSATYMPGDSFTSDANTTLYAIWQGAAAISSNVTSSSCTTSISFADGYKYYSFTPNFSGKVRFESTGSLDTQVYLYDAYGNELSWDDDSGDSYNFLLDYSVTSGTKYYLKVKMYSNGTGTINFTVKRLYDVVYNANGGTGAPDAQIKVHGEALTLSSTVPSREGYGFWGWSTNSAATTTDYQVGDNYSGNSDLFLYAVWVPPCSDGHSYTAMVTEPTCTWRGYTIYNCSVCGDWYQGDFTEPLGHSCADGVCVRCGVAFPATGTCGENAYWKLEESALLTVYGTGAMYDYVSTNDSGAPWGPISTAIMSVVIEEGVTTVGNSAFAEMGSIGKVIIGDSVISIGERAFERGCAEVVLGKNVKSIGYRAFSSNGITHVTIPASVEFIDTHAFVWCVSLENIVFEGDAPAFGDDIFLYVGIAKEKTVAYYPANNPTWTSDVLQSHGGNITWIPYYPTEEVASGWSGATQWTLTDDGTLTVYGMGNMKNYGYNGGQPWLNKGVDITSVVIEEGVSAIGTGAFRNLTTLESVTLPDKGLTKIGEAAFYGCASLKEIELPETIYTVWLYTFKNCTALEEVKLPKSLIKVDQGAFENCTSLPYIYFPTNVEIIGSWSFKGCTGLVEADMTWTDATKIREGAFKNCSSLTTIHLPVNIQTLGDSCFYGIGATSFTVPDTVTSIEAWCFARAYSLKNLYFKGNAPTIGQGAFNKITLTAYYPKGNTTWTSAVKQNYGGTVTWTAQ